MYNQHFKMLFFVTTFLIEGTTVPQEARLFFCRLSLIVYSEDIAVHPNASHVTTFTTHSQKPNEEERGSRHFHSISVISVDM